MANKTSNSVTVLACGDVLGKFKNFFRIVNKVNAAKGPFEAIYCTGSFFGDDNREWESVKSGEIKIAISCYILGPSNKQHSDFYPSDSQGTELAPNIVYLGSKGFLTTASGLKIAYLSGLEGRSPDVATFTSKDVTDLQCNFKDTMMRGVDFLLTSQWPKDVNRYCPSKQEVNVNGSELISYLAMTLKPCYHFAAIENIFYQRAPYRNTRTYSDSNIPSTRFVGLGNIGSAIRMHFIYGLTHVPLHAAKTLQAQKQPEFTTECPYQINMTQNTLSNLSESQPKDTHSPNGRNDRSKKPRNSSQPKRKLQCWFCLGMKTDEHLIVNVGEHCYVALAKGWLVPDHFLIIPHSHFRDMAHLPTDVINEVEDYKHLLRKHFASQQKTVVFYERSYKCFHMQLQAVVLPEKLRDSLQEIFLDSSSIMNIPLDEIPPYSEVKQIVGYQKQYFYLEIEGNNGRVRKFIHVIAEDFPLEFARTVLAKRGLLNLPDRVDWKKCNHSFEEEKFVSKNAQNIFH